MDGQYSDRAADRRQYPSIDLWKFVFSFAVVALHTGPLEKCEVEWVQKLYAIVTQAAVPFFFLAAGFLLGQKLVFDAGPSGENGRILKNYLFRIGKMYLLWSAIYLPLAVIHFILEKTPFSEAILRYLTGLVFVGEQYNSWVLWYLLSTFYAILVILLVIRKQAGFRRLLCLSLAASVLVAVFDAIGNDSSDLQGIWNTARTGIRYLLSSGRIFNGLVYIPLGIVLSKKKARPAVCWVLLLAGAAGQCFIGNRICRVYLLIATAVGWFGIVREMRMPESRVYPALRSMSTTIYLIHLYLWTGYYTLVYGTKTYSADCFAAVSAASFLIAYAYWRIRQGRRMITRK